MKTAYVRIFCALSCVFVLLSNVAPVLGGCLNDGDTWHADSDYARQDWSYTSNAPRTPSTSSSLKFLSFNIQSGYHTNCVNDVAAQARLMRDYDYVGNQEVVQGVDTRCSSCKIPEIIANVAGMSTRFKMAIPFRTGQYGTQLGTSQTILDTKTLHMPTPGYESRTAIGVKTQPEALKGRNLWFVNTHIEYYNSDVRKSQLRQVLDWIQANIANPDPSAVIVVTGDFNGGPWDHTYATMKSASFKNSWEMFAGSIEGGNTIPADWPGSRFDHIWYRVPTGVTVVVKSAGPLDVRMSDHRPTAATLEFSVTASNPATQAPPPPTAATQAPSSGQSVCVGPIFENSDVIITCPNPTMTISSVEFASYGTPTGACGNFQLGNCIGGASMAVAKDKCLGRATCRFPIHNNVFGDPCPGVGKRFVAQVTCK